MWVVRSDTLSAFQLIPEVITGAKVRSVCRTLIKVYNALELFHAEAGLGFQRREICYSKDVLYNCVLPTLLYQQTGDVCLLVP